MGNNSPGLSLLAFHFMHTKKRMKERRNCARDKNEDEERRDLRIPRDDSKRNRNEGERYKKSDRNGGENS